MLRLVVSSIIAIALCSSAFAQPAGDCADPIPISEGVMSFSTSGGGLNGDWCGFLVFNSAFYLFEAPTTGFWRFTTFSSRRMLLYDELDCPAPGAIPLACALCSLDVFLTEGEAYLLQIGERSSNTSSAGQLRVEPAPVFEFIRGDVDGNGTVHGVIDALFLSNRPAIPSVDS